MNINLILLCILCHFLMDFLFQNDTILKLRFPSYKKKSTDIVKSMKGNFYHTLVHFIGLFFIVGGYSVYNNIAVPFFSLFIITIGHFIIDFIKSFIIIYFPDFKDNLWIFLIDQMLHIVVILVSFLRSDNSAYEFNNTSKILLIAIVFLLSTYVSGIFIKILIKYISKRDKFFNDEVIINNRIKNSGAKNGGFIIGILERTFILVIMILNQPSIIGFVLAVKSVARFKKLEDENFAEYFIIGTFISFIIAIIGGRIIYLLFQSY
ncbi:DUF3307 domain-containing protein [Clostridium bornimense]|uniref:DUF3307 domain-containing protein n=1 Tax=Clostridium bornimense TaxID=1216932 RepID=UPI001C10FDD4|nr:DUF3307 domain-containing protein [Clostridium bornimense]MBU5317608.1 DUF3307 domain-containing protein [Clostridium bornimense]